MKQNNAKSFQKNLLIKQKNYLEQTFEREILDPVKTEARDTVPKCVKRSLVTVLP